MQHLADRQVHIELHLVEPSALALQAAVAYTQAQAQHHAIQPQVHAHHCGLDQLPDELFIRLRELNCSNSHGVLR